MVKPTVAFFELEPWEKRHIKRKLRAAKPVFFDGTLTAEKAKSLKRIDGLATFIFSKIDRKVLSHLRGLKLVTTMSTGFDHIDLKACAKNKVTVCNVPSYGSNTVAEHGFTMLLALSRKLLPAIDQAREGKVDYPSIRGFDLNGKTMGILGTGRIGQHMARIARGFGMEVIAWDKFPNVEAAMHLHFTYEKTIDAVLKKADVISLHLPLLPQTKHIIDRRAFKKIKKGAILINTARGGLIDTGALLKALGDGTLSGAGIDVLEEECAIKEEKELLHSKECDMETVLQEHMLMKLDNVIVTPHNAFNSVEALERIMDTTISNIERFFKGEPVNVVGAKK